MADPTSFIATWFTPFSIFIFVNLVIGTIALTSPPTVPVVTGLFAARGVFDKNSHSQCSFLSGTNKVKFLRQSTQPCKQRRASHCGALRATCRAEKILIANRGEIAVRVIRTAHELGTPCVAVYSTVDKDALHVKLADESVCIGEAPSSQSYLLIPNVLAAAVNRKCTMLNPGYGFLAEKHLAAWFNKSDSEIVDHYTYVILGDGCQMEGNCLQLLHCIEHGICRTVPLPHTCVSPPCTLAEVGNWNYEPKMECEDIWVHYSLLPSNVSSPAFCYLGRPSNLLMRPKTIYLISLALIYLIYFIS